MNPNQSNWKYLLPLAKHVKVTFPVLTAEQREQQERAIQAAFGILKGKGVFPEDALDYQHAVRSE